jgi:hypothetical protein
MSNPTALFQKLWNYCNILRDDGLSYGDYVEQLAFLLFLKMADEQARPPFNKAGQEQVSLLTIDTNWFFTGFHATRPTAHVQPFGVHSGVILVPAWGGLNRRKQGETRSDRPSQAWSDWQFHDLHEM